MYAKIDINHSTATSDQTQEVMTVGELGTPFKTERVKSLLSELALPISDLLTPRGMLLVAVQRGSGIEELSKLMDLLERNEKNEARKAYSEDMAAFKRTPPTIFKDRQALAGPAKWKHAELNQVAGKIAEALSQHGFSHRWDVSQNGTTISVTCTVTHLLGHSESVTISAPPDASGSKSPIHQVASTITYLERYTILAVTGLATGEHDDDDLMVTSEMAYDLVYIMKSESMSDLHGRYSEVYKKAEAKGDNRSMTTVIKIKNERKAQLSGGVR